MLKDTYRFMWFDAWIYAHTREVQEDHVCWNWVYQGRVQIGSSMQTPRIHIFCLVRIMVRIGAIQNVVVNVRTKVRVSFRTQPGVMTRARVRSV